MRRSRSHPRGNSRTHSAPRRERASASPPPNAEGSFVIGRNAVRELLRHSPKRIRKLLSSAAHGGDSEIEQLAAAASIQVEPVDDETLSATVGTHSHQSYAAVVSEHQHLALAELLEEVGQAERSLVVLLDSISDPQNLGAIMRACECFGVDALVWSKNRGVALTPVVTKASVGASELLSTVVVSNLNDALHKLRDAGYWIVAADGAAPAQSIAEFEFPQKCAIIFGSEGEGIQRLLLEESDFKVAVPMCGKIDSLNVSQAVSVFLYKYRERFSQSSGG